MAEGVKGARSTAGQGRAGDGASPALQGGSRDWLQALGFASLLGAIAMLALLAGSLIRALLVAP